MLETATLDEKKVETFAEDLLQTMNRGALSLMISLGHRSGLFDTLACLPAASSARIAEAAGLNERYVREWLGAMVTGRIVQDDPDRKTYRLPAEHAACLTRAASPNNMAAFSQFLPVLASVEDDILRCFHEGGGVPYEGYRRFHQTMAEESNQTVVHHLTDSILPLVPGLAEALERGVQVLDVGCGVGRALHRLAEVFPRSTFQGYDLCPEAIAEARRGAPANLRFEALDVTGLEAEGAYDLVTAFDSIHDQARPARVLANIHRALKPGGAFLMQDIKASSHVHKNLDHPLGTFLYTVSCMHCMSVSLCCGGAGLGTVWGEELAVQMLQEAGFPRVEVHQLPHDILNNFYVCRRA